MATTKVKVKNETSEERQRREDAEQLSRDVVEELDANQSDEEAILARLDESETDREQRREQHIADERAVADVGRVQEIARGLARDEIAYLNKLDNAARRLRGLAGSNVPAVTAAVQAVAKRFDISVTREGLRQPKPSRKPDDFLYPFYA